MKDDVKNMYGRLSHNLNGVCNEVCLEIMDSYVSRGKTRFHNDCYRQTAQFQRSALNFSLAIPSVIHYVFSQYL